LKVWRNFLEGSKRRVLILGSTGSIGESTIDIVKRFPERFEVVGLVAGRNREKLLKQAQELDVKNYVLFSERGLEGIKELVESTDFDVAVCAISGSAGILPTYWASRKGGRIALANKESLVCAGEFIKREAKEIVPVDSEHSAVFQCLIGERKEDVEEIVLTASGGAFLERKDLENVRPEEALKHPNWDMGKKVTVDSSTLMNKGLEVIEAYWLFELPLDRIKVVIHPQSIVHSLVVFKDKSVKAQIGIPDMRIPISYALSYPERLELGEEMKLNLFGLNLSFLEPDVERFPCLKLAYESLERGYPYPIVLNAADEVAVELFLNGKIRFTDIPKLIEEALNRADFKKPETVEEVVEIDRRAKELTLEIFRRFH
jgi:1-deoxy-D-xylulose-5-phosphate reductoisomerase